MAASALPSDPSPEVFSWLKTLPLAPEYHPTLAEFQDPISYIFKIEKEASKYGICKIVPPVPPSPKKTVIANLNKSLAARAGSPDGSGPKTPPTFTTRQQQIGFCPRKPRPVQRPVWQSGEHYTFQEFEAKAKGFEKGFFKKCAKKGGNGGGPSALEIETLYWKATVDKPFSVEYANDMPGSAFAPVRAKKVREAGESVTLGETSWNMRAVSRSKGSLLRFMKEEIPGVTSPMVYVAMMFSWFAWHVEDHDLHSLNYMHMGAGKTWYGVPREAAVAFEEVVRVHGYGGEINPLVTFSVLGEKTTVMSPEVFITAGVPCCRLVQNAGEFVVTFPRAYHTGFSHGFNCGEAANIATPEWLRVAKDAAIRRASINYPPMVSHFQLLYDLALALCSRIPVSISAEPRSSRLKDKKKGEGETVVKELFVQNVLQNNDLLHVLGKGSPIVLLPRSSSDISLCSKLRVGSQLRLNASFPLGSCNSREEMKSSGSLISDDLMIDRKQDIDQVRDFYPVKGKLASLCEGSWVPSLRGNKSTSTLNSKTPNMNIDGKSNVDGDRLSDQRLFSCVTCGILSFDCVAIVQPRDPATRYLMSADCSFFNDWVVNAGVANNVFPVSSGDQTASMQNTYTGWTDNNAPLGSCEVPVQSVTYQVQTEDPNNEVVSNSETHDATSALGLLALNYGNSSDSEEDPVQEDVIVDGHEINTTNCSLESKSRCESSSLSLQNCQSDAAGVHGCSPRELDSREESASQNADAYMENGQNRDNAKYNSHQNLDCSVDFGTNNIPSTESNLVGKIRDSIKVSQTCSPCTYDAEATKFCKAIAPMKNENVPFAPICDEDSSRMHVFCLEHAVEVEQQLRQIGGVHILLLCHPDYPKIEAEAKSMAEELGINDLWNNTTFRDATKDDQERIQSALDSEEAMPKNGDWAVKLGINLFYSANLSRSPLYSKQMPYNSVIYNAFGRSSPASSPTRSDGFGRRPIKKKVVAGKWCGRVWMSSQVHPFLAKRNPEEEEEVRGFLGWGIPDEKLDRKYDSTNRNSNAIITKKYVRKRKMKVENESTKKAKCIKREDAVSENSMDDDSLEHRRSLRSKQAIRIEAGSTKKGKHIQMEDAISDDSMEDNSHRQRKRTLKSKQATFIETDDMVSDDSLGVDSHHRNKKIPRSGQAKHTGREDAFSDDSLDSDSHQLRRRVTKSKQARHTGIQDVVFGDSLESESNPPHRRIPRSKQAKFMEGEDSASDDFTGTNLYKQKTRIYKSKLAKSIEREDEVSDEPVEANAHQEDKRILRSKQRNSAMQQKRKLETSRMRPATSRPVKQSTRQLVKQETPKLKQQTTRLRNNQCEQNTLHVCAEEEVEGGPSTRLRKRAPKTQKTAEPKRKEQQPTSRKKVKNALAVKAQAGRSDAKLKDEEAEYMCDVEGCTMSFGVKHELVLHKRNICPVKGCGKKFFSHKYLVQHRRVHMDDRPLRCPWKGCKMTFKWAWARTEHIRVHTGARPYVCTEPGCGQTFRFVSDFSRHKRKTGHSAKKGR
ncbi:TFIIH C1-like domain containing protein [Parasponia andersonii]|uniref:TFIIH C1-like domain containing protein n=1 Tax=Parasponia andersonii TaxID=3476 RepID=A0A2P5BA48_PARAD|nr:TFIIH C1-like domain containing protein [Parasponia andersonii]